MLQVCERQVRVFTELVNNLLDLSRIAEGSLELQREEVDLAVLVRDVVGRFGHELERAGCVLCLRADVTAVGWWDRARLEQVIINLLSNAMKYGRAKPLEIAVEAGVSAARLTVRDHGIGIAPEDQARVFGKFERAAPGHEFGGLGMGLYIVRQIVDALGGSVAVASEAGKGATFSVSLPYALPTEGQTVATKA
jgi:signal transduction histidine kinase